MNFSIKPSGKTGFTLIEIMIVVTIIGILLGIAIPQIVRARDDARSKGCIENLSHIDSAKAQFIMDNNLGSFTNAISPGDSSLGGLVPKYLPTIPVCPSGGTYNTGGYGTLPTCSIGTSGTYPHVLT